MRKMRAKTLAELIRMLVHCDSSGPENSDDGLNADHNRRHHRVSGG
jgi:hypothetical protein